MTTLTRRVFSQPFGGAPLSLTPDGVEATGEFGSVSHARTHTMTGLEATAEQGTPTLTGPAFVSTNRLYFNSRETGGDGSDPNCLLADDFITGLNAGEWYHLDADNNSDTPTNPAFTKGWEGTIYANPIVPSGAVRGGGEGFGGKLYTATHGALTGVNGGGRNMAEHKLSEQVDALYYRFYTKPLASYSFGAEKVLDFNQNLSDGIKYGNLHFNCGAGSASSSATLQWQPVASAGYGSCFSIGTILSNHWYYIEVFIQLNTGTNANGILRVWLNDCGTGSGANPGGSPTLAFQKTDMKFLGNVTASDHLGAVWHENWSNPGGTGERYLDCIYARKAAGGQIGFYPI